MKKALLGLIMLVTLVGCGISSESSTTSSDLSYNYSLTVGSSSCTTGQRAYANTSDLCAKLQNSSLNNNCAQCQRQSRFQAEGCSGTFSGAVDCVANPLR